MTETQRTAMRAAHDALELAQENLRGHGDNCFLHDDGEYNSCFCGLDSVKSHLMTVTEEIAAALAEPVMDYERHQATKECERNASEDAYFAARPAHDHGVNRTIFRHGFDRGYDAALQAHPVMDRESSWFALVMSAAAELEDASNCLQDPDAKRTATRGAEYYRNAAKAMSSAQHPAPVQEPTCKQALQVQAHKTTGWVAPKNQYAVPVFFNPYTGEPRDVRDVQSDPQGVLIVPPGKVDVLAAQQPAPPADVPLLTDDELREAFAQSLTSTYVCGRVWSAWSYGTMSEDDFSPASECDELLDSLVQAVRQKAGLA